MRSLVLRRQRLLPGLTTSPRMQGFSLILPNHPRGKNRAGTAEGRTQTPGGTMKRFLSILVFSVFFLVPTSFAQHSVTLTWVASADAAANPSLTYNIFRSVSTCAAATTFAQINTAAITTTTFTDTSVSVGNTYCYEATAVLNGVQSADSNTAQAVILPAPPSSLVAKSD